MQNEKGIFYLIKLYQITIVTVMQLFNTTNKYEVYFNFSRFMVVKADKINKFIHIYFKIKLILKYKGLSFNYEDENRISLFRLENETIFGWSTIDLKRLKKIII